MRFPFQIDLKERASIFVRRVESDELFAGVDLRQHLQTINVSTEWFKSLAVSEGLEWGQTPNYFPGAGTLPFVARFTSGSFSVTIRPNPRIRYEQTLLYTGLRTSRSADRPRPIVIFSNTIERSTASWSHRARPVAIRTAWARWISAGKSSPTGCCPARRWRVSRVSTTARRETVRRLHQRVSEPARG